MSSMCRKQNIKIDLKDAYKMKGINKVIIHGYIFFIINNINIFIFNINTF